MKPSVSNKPLSVDNGFDRQVRTIEVAWAVLFVAFFSMVIAYSAKFSKNGWSTEPDAWGQFGDFIGGVLNPLVSLAALFALVVSVRMQRSELNDTRAELIEARKVATEQSKTADQQRREQRFFDLLNLYQRTVDSVGWSETRGKSAISNWRYNFDRIPNLHTIHTFLQKGFIETVSIEKLNTSWNSAEISDYLGPYFRVIHQILLQANDLLGADAQRYIKILRAQFNSDELTLLTLNLWLNPEGKTILPYATEFGLLKYLPEGNLKNEVAKTFETSIFDSTEVRQ
jgi:Putative phage abortive infection protein